MADKRIWIQTFANGMLCGSLSPDVSEAAAQRTAQARRDMGESVGEPVEYVRSDAAKFPGDSPVGIVLRKAPWPDAHGNDLYEGDVLYHPSGESGVIRFAAEEDELTAQWRVDYGDRPMSRLCLQVGEKGQGHRGEP